MTDRRQLLNDLDTSIRIALDGRQSTIWTCMPCIVTSVNWTNMTVEAQPTIQGVVENPNGSVQFVNLPLLLDVPIYFPSGGGFTFTFPIKKDDEILVIFASRCIDGWWQNGGVQAPVEMRFHDLSDGFAFCGPKSLPNVISSINTSKPELRNNAGSIKIEFTAAGFKLTGNLEVTGNIVASGEVTGNGIALSTHTHPVSVPSTPFSGNTGAP